MKCSNRDCDGKMRVVGGGVSQDGMAYIRRRKCDKCKLIIYTVEREDDDRGRIALNNITKSYKQR